MTDPALSSCCQSRMFLDPMECNSSIFAHVARCLKCRGFKGEAKIAYTAPKAIAAAWNGVAHLLMVEWYSKNRKFSPLRFKLSGTLIVPEGMPAQVEMEAGEEF